MGSSLTWLAVLFRLSLAHHPSLLQTEGSAQLHRTAAPQSASEQNLVRAIVGNWDGAMGDVAKGNSPAQLRILLQKSTLTGLLTYGRFEETLSIKISGPSAIRLKGISYRDLEGAHRNFDLDTMEAQVSPDFRRLSGTTVDTRGTRSRFEFRRVE